MWTEVIVLLDRVVKLPGQARLTAGNRSGLWPCRCCSPHPPRAWCAHPPACPATSQTNKLRIWSKGKRPTNQEMIGTQITTRWLKVKVKKNIWNFLFGTIQISKINRGWYYKLTESTIYSNRLIYFSVNTEYLICISFINLSKRYLKYAENFHPDCSQCCSSNVSMTDVVHQDASSSKDFGCRKLKLAAFANCIWKYEGTRACLDPMCT